MTSVLSLISPGNLIKNRLVIVDDNDTEVKRGGRKEEMEIEEDQSDTVTFISTLTKCREREREKDS